MTHNEVQIRILNAISFLFSFVFGTQASVPEEKQITVVFRFDDYSSRSPTDIEYKIIDAFKKYNISCTFGVIPYITAGDVHDTSIQDVVPLTPMKADILKNAIKAGVEVALHGYSHQTIRKISAGRHTEFSGLDYDSQVKKIAKGKTFLEGMLDMRVTGFIPPWSTYDSNTIRALEKLGFEYISTDGFCNAKKSSLLKFLPVTCSILHVRDAVKLARHIPGAEPIVVVLFHPHDFIEVNKLHGRFTYAEFVELLAWLTSQKDIYVRTINQTINVTGDLSADRFLDYYSFLILSRVLPPFLKKIVFF